MAELLLEQKVTMRTAAGGLTGVHHMQMSVCVRALLGRMGQSECDELTHGDFAEIQGPAPNTLDAKFSRGLPLSTPLSWLVSQSKLTASEVSASSVIPQVRKGSWK